MSEFKVRRATRQGITPLIMFYSVSGAGKTFSSLLLARGIVGPKGKICLVDSESGRGSLYADVIEGGYDVLELSEPFSPARYTAAVREVEQSGAEIGILDSGSHEWEGIGGVLDIAGEEEQRGMKGLGVWKKPKLEHAKFVLKMLQSPIPWIICLRAKHKSRQVKERGRTEIVKDDHCTPIQADDFIFEATAHAEILPDHTLTLTKWSHPGLKACFPVGKPITIETGKAVAAWCNSPSKPAQEAATAPVEASEGAEQAQDAPTERKSLLLALRAVTEPIHGWKDGDPHSEWQAAKSKMIQWLVDEALIDPDNAQLESLGDLALAAVLKKTKERMKKA